MRTGRLPRSMRHCIRHNGISGGETVRNAFLKGLLTVLCALCCTGCRREEPPVFEPTANHTVPVRTMASSEADGTADTTETAAEPRDPELDARLQALYEATPVPIPEGGWTDETLQPVLLVCGKPAESPFCLKDLLYGYSFREEGNSYFEIYAERFFSHQLMLSGGTCAMTDVFADEQVPEDAMPEKNMLDLSADWVVITPDGGERYPISINCVTIGSTLDEVRERIGEVWFMGDEGEDGFFRAECKSESWRATVTGSQKKVSTIILYDRKANSDPTGK